MFDRLTSEVGEVSRISDPIAREKREKGVRKDGGVGVYIESKTLGV